MRRGLQFGSRGQQQVQLASASASFAPATDVQTYLRDSHAILLGELLIHHLVTTTPPDPLSALAVLLDLLVRDGSFVPQARQLPPPLRPPPPSVLDYLQRHRIAVLMEEWLAEVALARPQGASDVLAFSFRHFARAGKQRLRMPTAANTSLAARASDAHSGTRAESVPAPLTAAAFSAGSSGFLDAPQPRYGRAHDASLTPRSSLSASPRSGSPAPDAAASVVLPDGDQHGANASLPRPTPRPYTSASPPPPPPRSESPDAPQ